MLPPLRNETLIQLATNQEELGQSYERRNIFAGRYNESTYMDWAPIYLSPRLLDTEYGSLLNITDQMLKSWTEHGTVRYVNFKYPDPSTFPFPEPFTKYLDVQELVFNWNTKGAGDIARSCRYEIFALNRTGALPIDYLAAGRPNVQDAEDTAYKYYAKLNDPNLIRVVQYAAVYQIFHHFGIHSSSTADFVSQSSPVLADPAKDIIRRIAKHIGQESLYAAINGSSDKSEREFGELVGRTRDALKSLLPAEGEKDSTVISTIALAAVDRNSLIRLVNSGGQQGRQLASLVNNIQEIAPKRASNNERNDARMRYEVSIAHTKDSWIRTPTIVESSGGKNGGIGGHNLYSKVTVFEADSAVDAAALRWRTPTTAGE